MVNILIADDQPEVCSALRLLLEQSVGGRIVGEAANAQDLWQQLDTLHPDVVLLDWELPGLSGDKGVPWLRQFYGAVRIVALSSRPDAGRVAVRAGADAFVCKGDPPERLLAVLRDHTL